MYRSAHSGILMRVYIWVSTYRDAYMCECLYEGAYLEYS